MDEADDLWRTADASDKWAAVEEVHLGKKVNEWVEQRQRAMQGLAPFVESVRVFALAHGVEAANTLERIDALARKDIFDAKDANAWKEAYSLIQAIRMRAHQEMLDRGEELTNYIDPDDLNPLDRRILRESFRQAQRLQQKLEVTYQL